MFDFLHRILRPLKLFKGCRWCQAK